MESRYVTVEPGWHYWLGYGTNTPPIGDAKTTRAYPLPAHHKPNLTNTQVLMFVIILLNQKFKS